MCFLDSDDLFVPDKVRSVVEIFERNQQVGWCFKPAAYVRSRKRSSPGSPQAKLRIWRVRCAQSHPRSPDHPFLPTATSASVVPARRPSEAFYRCRKKIHITSDNYVKFRRIGVDPRAGWIRRNSPCNGSMATTAYTNRPTNKNRVFGRIALAHWNVAVRTGSGLAKTRETDLFARVSACFGQPVASIRTSKTDG